jgi:hypothetical protein
MQILERITPEGLESLEIDHHREVHGGTQSLRDDLEQLEQQDQSPLVDLDSKQKRAVRIKIKKPRYKPPTAGLYHRFFDFTNRK